MGFAFTAQETRSSYGTGSLATDNTIAVSVGDLIVVAGGSNSASRTVNGISDSAGNSYTLLPQLTGVNSFHRLGYTIVTSASAALTITVTFDSGGATTRLINAAVFTPDAGDTVSLDIDVTKISGYEASPWETGADNTTGTDAVAIAFFISGGGQTYSNQEIPGGTAATVLTSGNTNGTFFYRLLTATVSGIYAEVDTAASNRYVAEMLVFKSVATGGTVAVLRRRINGYR